MIDLEGVQGAVARGWCHPTTSHKEMDSVLAIAIADEVFKYLTTLDSLMKSATKREHITDGSPCWCNPETVYTDPDDGASVIVHKEPQ